MFIEIPKKRCESRVEVDYLVFQGKESAAYRPKSVGLYDRPFLYNFGVILSRKVHAYFVWLAGGPIEPIDF